jgi:thiamine biosynthesis lipoprotein ApbE
MVEVDIDLGSIALGFCARRLIKAALRNFSLKTS